MTTEVATALSPGQKLRIIHDGPKAHKLWTRSDLTRDERKWVLASIEIGLTDADWLCQVIKDARDMHTEDLRNFLTEAK